ncbi:MAG: glycosyltransferase family 4 protein [Paracoccaceae bacterium]|nr:glycosyltransferase family 4 protein [Paracoccaceae bacterium]MDP5349302.1 glycosyltransferase family 4 protein [Paracoccaceae bacterium]MDP5365627.1 glycosyltransferase family 4 protein [Paracoccaceae bacterium]
MNNASQDPDRRVQLKIGYLCDFDPRDPGPYSGGNQRIFNALSANVDQISILDTSWGIAEPVSRRIGKMSHDVQLRLRWRAQLALSPVIARHIERQIAKSDINVLFCAYSFQSLAAVRLPQGVISAFTCDATPTIYKQSPVGQSFKSFFSASRLMDPLITAAERATFRRTDLLLWASDWLNDAAISLYGLTPDQSKVLNWGANIPPPEAERTSLAIATGQPLRLLFVGRDWVAKGGPTTVALLRCLRQRGVDARLSVVGTTPPPEDLDPAIEVYPYLDKSDPEQLAIFTHLFRTAHFMVMLSFESYGFAYCEASAYGVPSLALRVAGVPVEEGVNGHRFDTGTDPETLADRIMHYLSDPAAYAALRSSSRAFYEDRLNWDAWGRHAADLLRGKLLQHQTANPTAG